MNRRIFGVLIVLLCLCFCQGCYSDGTPSQNTEATTIEIDQTESNYIIKTDWMTFYFSQKDYDRMTVSDIASEAVHVMADIRDYFCVSYSEEEAKGAECYFDNSYRNNDGLERSTCFWREKKIYCVSLDSFIHEYVHMICENNQDLVYHPDKLFCEGLAEYVSLTFFESIATQDYLYFKEEAVSPDSAPSEHRMICELLEGNGLSYTAENYNKAFAALFDYKYDVSKIDPDSYFYKYYIGFIFVDYCINHLGGLAQFLSAYCDSATVPNLYGKTVDKIVKEACAYNTSLFYKTQKTD